MCIVRQVPLSVSLSRMMLILVKGRVDRVAWVFLRAMGSVIKDIPVPVRYVPARHMLQELLPDAV